MRGDLRRENARIYAEMYEEGIEPFRGSWLSITLLVVCFVLVIAVIMAVFYAMFAIPTHFINDIFTD